MNRTDLERYIFDAYHCEPDRPWITSPDNEVFRHYRNRKWFALIMEIPRNRLGLDGDESMDVVNVKCDPFLIETLWDEMGFFPAYHMNKHHWITIALDGSAPDDKIRMLLDMSYEATAPKN